MAVFSWPTFVWNVNGLSTLWSWSLVNRKGRIKILSLYCPEDLKTTFFTSTVVPPAIAANPGPQQTSNVYSYQTLDPAKYPYSPTDFLSLSYQDPISACTPGRQTDPVPVLEALALLDMHADMLSWSVFVVLWNRLVEFENLGNFKIKA
jgi:hypothetical protein